jgi:hypothetical protein
MVFFFPLRMRNMCTFLLLGEGMVFSSRSRIRLRNDALFVLHIGEKRERFYSLIKKKNVKHNNIMF